MNPPVDEAVLQRVRESLRGYPPGTSEAAEQFLKTRSASALDAVTLGVLTQHLPTRVGVTEKRDVSAMPGTTQLVSELAFDSLSMVEMSFLLEDIIGVKIPDDDLRALVTIDDLKLLLRKHAGAVADGGAA